MRCLIAAALVALLGSAHARAQEVVPITLSADEYQRLINNLAMRDPTIAMLIKKQEAAQAAATAAQSRPPSNSANAPN